MAIVRMVVDLAHTSGMEVVAEGVERADQLAQLLEMGCDMDQGYYFARPLPRRRPPDLSRAGPLPRSPQGYRPRLRRLAGDLATPHAGRDLLKAQRLPDEPQRLFGAAPRERDAGAAVAVVVHDGEAMAYLALQPDLGTPRPEADPVL